MKSVLYVVQGAGGGVSRYLVDLISNLSRDKFRVGVVFNSKFEDNRFSTWRKTADYVTFFDVDSMVREISVSSDLQSIKQIRRIISEFKPDVVHAQSSKAGFVARIAAKQMHVHRIVYTPHAYAFLSPEFSAKKRAVYTLAEQFLGRFFTDVTINCSHSENKHALNKHIDKPRKLVTIANAVPPIKNIERGTERARLNLDKDALVIGNLARVSTQKNPSLFEAIAKEAIKLNSRLQFVWIGSNPDNRKSEYVSYLGEMNDTQELIAGMDLYLSTSLFEGLSYSLLEAAAVGVPVFASNVPGNDEFIAGYNRAYSFELVDSPGVIAAELVKLVAENQGIPVAPAADGFEKMIHDTIAVY